MDEVIDTTDESDSAVYTVDELYGFWVKTRPFEGPDLITIMPLGVPDED